MQPVSRLAPARPPARVGTTCQAPARATTSRGGCAWRVGVAPPRAPRLLGLLPRARAAACGGGARATEPVEARKDVDAVGQDQAQAEAGLAPEELEVLEEEAIAGEDEGRRPTDYDRRAHIFEESSRVFRELKHQRDGDGHGGPANAATAAENGRREQQQHG